MENKVVLLFFILIEAVILAFCETDSFGPRLNGQIDPETLDLTKRKDFYLFESNGLGSEVKNVAKRPVVFNERYSEPADTVNTVEMGQDLSRTNFSEEQNEMSEFHQDRYNNWQQEKNRAFYPNRQENQQETLVAQTLNRRIIPHSNNEWDRSENFFQNSKSRWNEEKNFRLYQTGMDLRNEENYDGRMATFPNAGRPTMYTDVRNANLIEKQLMNNRAMNAYFQPKNDVPERKASLTLLNEDIKSVNTYDQELIKNRFNVNSKINYYNRNSDGFRNPNFRNPEKGVVINFNTECPTRKSFSNPIFHKFIFASKPQNPEAEIPAFQIPETTLITRQMSTPIYYL